MKRHSGDSITAMKETPLLELDDSYQFMPDSSALQKQIHRLRATVGCLGLLLVGAVAAILFMNFRSSVSGSVVPYAVVP